MREPVRVFRGLILSVCTVAVLTACGSSDSKKDSAAPGKRIPVMEAAHKPIADRNLADFALDLPVPAVNTEWAQNGGNVFHAPGNPALASVPEKVWSSSIGTGSDGDYKLLSKPVISGNALYVMDAKGRVSAYDMRNGDRSWRIDTAPKGRDYAIGGGVAYEANVVYATTGFGEVLALRASDGVVLWRRSVSKPIRSAPTVAEGRVFAITIENETHALDARTGQIIWHHSGIAENATLMGASSPAVAGDTVVVAYSSGEVFGLRAQNGRVVWGEVLAVPTQVGALPAIADIRGLPVVDKNRVFAISHSGRMASLDLRSGDRVWEADIGGVNTPSVVGNAVYVVSNDSQLVALTRDSGRIIWTTDLQKLKDPTDHDSKPVSWWGPVMAGGRLWLTNSLGHLAAYAPESGYALYDKDVGDPFFLPPVISNRTMVLLEDDGDLKAMK